MRTQGSRATTPSPFTAKDARTAKENQNLNHEGTRRKTPRIRTEKQENRRSPEKNLVDSVQMPAPGSRLVETNKSWFILVGEPVLVRTKTLRRRFCLNRCSLSYIKYCAGDGLDKDSSWKAKFHQLALLIFRSFRRIVSRVTEQQEASFSQNFDSSSAARKR